MAAAAEAVAAEAVAVEEAAAEVAAAAVPSVRQAAEVAEPCSRPLPPACSHRCSPEARRLEAAESASQARSWRTRPASTSGYRPWQLLLASVYRHRTR